MHGGRLGLPLRSAGHLGRFALRGGILGRSRRGPVFGRRSGSIRTKRLENTGCCLRKCRGSQQQQSSQCDSDVGFHRPTLLSQTEPVVEKRSVPLSPSSHASREFHARQSFVSQHLQPRRTDCCDQCAPAVVARTGVTVSARVTHRANGTTVAATEIGRPVQASDLAYQAAVGDRSDGAPRSSLPRLPA